MPYYLTTCQEQQVIIPPEALQALNKRRQRINFIDTDSRGMGPRSRKHVVWQGLCGQVDQPLSEIDFEVNVNILQIDIQFRQINNTPPLI